ncbi:MAG: hypothetical protein LBD53_01460 [Tannerella sp.]|jgi:hypothetical protein|nr:hypothetical protein [Tannerella sp.]
MTVPLTLAVVLNPASGLERTSVVGRNEAIQTYRITGEAGFTGFYLDCFVPRNDECPVR